MSFVRRAAERGAETKIAVKGGPGQALNVEILAGEAEMYGKGHLFNEITLEKDCGVGYHLHEGTARPISCLQVSANIMTTVPSPPSGRAMSPLPGTVRATPLRITKTSPQNSSH